MTRENLQEASQHLESAAEAAENDDARERLHEQSDQLARLADRERGPDHGRLARHESAISDVADEEGGEVAEHVEAALSAIHAYRETIEGV